MRALAKRLGIAAIVFAAPWLVGCGGGGYGGSKGPTPTPVTTAGTVVVYPSMASVPVGGSINFLANLPSQPTASFKWTISGSNNGSISASGVYTAPTGSVPSPATFTVTATATSGSFVGTSTVTITAAQGVTLNPSALVVPAGATVNIAATSGGAAAIVTSWQVNGITGGDSVHGTITATGGFTAPLVPPSGGSTTVTAITAGGSGTANVTVVYSNNSLQGPYAFSYSGQSSAGSLVAAGSFTASSGTISAGLEDAVTQGTSISIPLSASTATGTYNIGPDGTGSATLTDGSTWQFVMVANPSGTPGGQPAQKAVLIRFDGAATGSGTIERQDTTVNSPMPAGAYAFTLSGQDILTTIFNAAGRFVSDGTATLSPGEWDVNDGATVVTSDGTLTGAFHTDLNNPNSGRGLLTLTTTSSSINSNARALSFVFYVVNGTHLKVIETDKINFTGGDIFSAPSSGLNTSELNGKYAFTNGGASTAAAYAQGGVFTADGNGTVLAGEMDVNGGVGGIFLNYAVTRTTYTVDGFGRIALQLEASSGGKNLGPYNYAGYVTSSGSVILVEVDNGARTVVSGMAFPQTATTALQGNYAANFAGIANSSSGSVEEDVAGEFIVNNTAIVTGTLDSNLSGSTGSGVPITQAVIVAADSTGRGTATIDTHLENFPLAYYTLDSNTVLVLETDGQRVVLGTITRQF